MSRLKFAVNVANRTIHPPGERADVAALLYSADVREADGRQSLTGLVPMFGSIAAYTEGFHTSTAQSNELSWNIVAAAAGASVGHYRCARRGIIEVPSASRHVLPSSRAANDDRDAVRQRATSDVRPQDTKAAALDLSASRISAVPTPLLWAGSVLVQSEY
jgi:hypothetical protein